MFGLKTPTFRCVITYQYEDRTVEITSDPTSQSHAEWLVTESGRLCEGSEHIVNAEAMSEQDYRRHVMRRVAEALVVS
jgi:hypothetical protein